MYSVRVLPSEMSARREVLSSLAESAELSPQVAVSAPVLFTEQEVAFGTAAARIPGKRRHGERNGTAVTIADAVLGLWPIWQHPVSAWLNVLWRSSRQTQVLLGRFGKPQRRMQ